MRSRRYRPRELPLPRRPYRDSVVFYAILAGIILLVAYLTGGGLGRALAVAVAFFLVATAWSWWRFRAKLRAQQSRR